MSLSPAVLFPVGAGRAAHGSGEASASSGTAGAAAFAAAAGNLAAGTTAEPASGADPSVPPDEFDPGAFPADGGADFDAAAPVNAAAGSGVRGRLAPGVDAAPPASVLLVALPAPAGVVIPLPVRASEPKATEGDAAGTPPPGPGTVAVALQQQGQSAHQIAPGTETALSLASIKSPSSAQNSASSAAVPGVAQAQSQVQAQPPVQVQSSVQIQPPLQAPVQLQAPLPASAPVTSAAHPAPLLNQLSLPLVRLAAAAPGEHVITVKVNPETLGPVTVRAHIGVDGVRVEMFAPTDSGREALRHILGDLRRDLAGGSTGAGSTLTLSDHSHPGGSSGGSTADAEARNGGQHYAKSAESTAAVAAVTDRPRISPPRFGFPGSSPALDVMA